MGIKNLNKLLRRYSPSVFEHIHISEFAFQKVAIDLTLYLCKYKAVCGDKWVPSFINLVGCLRRNQIHCVFIYDNGAPVEKNDEKAGRMVRKQSHEDKLKNIENAVEHYRETNEILPVLADIMSKNSKPRLIASKEAKPTLDMRVVEEEIEKLNRYIINITPEDFQLTRDLFDILEVPYYKATLEAETTCADLCKRGLVDAVFSEDTDVLAYATPIFLTKLDTFDNTCVKIHYDKVLENLDLKENEFLDLCIMLGTDYNKNIMKVGPETSYKYIKKYKTIEEIESKLSIDVSILNHKRSRELFTNYKHLDIKEIPYCGHPDFKKLEEFIRSNKININLENIKRDFDTTVTIFE